MRSILWTALALLALAAPADAWAQATDPVCGFASAACVRGKINTNPPAAQTDATLGPASIDAYGAQRVHPMDGAGHDVSTSNPLPVTIASVGASGVAVTSAASATNAVLKAAPGTLYGASVTTSTTVGYLMVLNATSLPANGAVSPVACYGPLPASQSFGAAWSTPVTLSTGITLAFSSTGCATLTAATAAFIAGQAQ